MYKPGDVPGVAVLHITQGETVKGYVHADGLIVHQPTEFEWMFRNKKIQWFNELYAASTVDSPAMHEFICTTIDLANYLNHLKTSEEHGRFMVIGFIHREDGVIDGPETYYIGEDIDHDTESD